MTSTPTRGPDTVVGAYGIEGLSVQMSLPGMRPIPRPTRHARVRRLTVEDVLPAQSDTPAPAEVDVQDAEPTLEVLCTSVLVAQGRLQEARTTAGMGEAAVAARKRAHGLLERAYRTRDTAAAELERAEAGGAPARAGLMRASLAAAQQQIARVEKHADVVLPGRRAQRQGDLAWRMWAAQQQPAQDAYRAAVAEVERAEAQVADRLERDRPSYLTPLAVDATTTERAAWRSNAVGIAVHRTRYGVTDPVRPLGLPPLDRTALAEYERVAKERGVVIERPEVERDRHLALTLGR